MPDIADVAWSEHDERNSESVPNGWPTGAFPAYTDQVGQMMMGATKRFWNKINPVYQTSGIGDNYVVQTEIGIDQINLYEILCIRIDRSNTTTTPTLQFGATNARTIVKAGPSGYVPLAAGDMYAGNSHTFWYNGAFYVLTDPAISNLQPLSPNLTSWAAITRATGFDTWVATPTSANLAALVGDETGTGALVFGTGPTLSAPLLAGGTSGTTTLQASANASGTLTLPAATDTLVGRATTDTLTNKTISGASNTITNVSLTTGVTGTLPIGNGGTNATTSDDARNNLAVVPAIATRTAIKALDVTKNSVVRLTEGNRGGFFYLTSGTPPYSDPSEGVFLISNTAGWYWDRRVAELNPAMFGASLDPTVDSSAAIQACITFMKQTYSYTDGGFVYSYNDDRWYRTTVSINMTGIQQPGWRIGKMALVGACAGQTVLDAAGLNVGTIDDLRIYGDATNIPQAAAYFGRCYLSGNLVAAPDLTIRGGHIRGYFSKAAYIQFASEVSNVSLTIENQSRSTSALGYVNAGHWGTITQYLGGLTSAFVTLPSAADGSQSNILHSVGIPGVTRGSDYYLAITSISKANPAVVTCNSAALIAAGIANGDKIFLGDIVGMTQLNPGTTNPSGVYTVANINTGAGTFELSGIDSTGYGTFTSGHVRNQTGPCVVLNGCASVTWDNFYTLAYGNPGIIFDNSNGIAMRDVSLGFQHEPSSLAPMRFGHPATAVEQEIPGLQIDFLNQFQQWTDCIFSSDAALGWTKLTNGSLNIRMLSGTIPPNKIFGTPGKFNLNGFNINVPLSSIAQDFTATPGWGASSTPDVIFSASDDPRIRAYGNFWQAYGDSPRVSTNRPFNSGALGVYDFVGLNSSGAEVIYGFMRGRIVVNTAGTEYGRQEFVYKVAGTDTVAYFIQGQLLQLQAASLGLMTGSASIAPLVWTAGTNKTTVAAGEWEFDGKAFYAACVASSRQVIATKQIATVQGSTVALSNSSTSAQNIFASANDVLTVAASTTYRFRARLTFNTGATSHTTAFGFGGTATFTACNYTSNASSSAAGTLSTPQMVRVAAATATVLTAASTAVTTDIVLEGVIRINAAGTIIPQVTFSAGPTGTCETALDSYFELEPIGSNTVAAVGNWA